MNEDYLLKIGEVIIFCNGHIYYDFIAIYNVFQMGLSSMLYIINDVIMCSTIIHFPVFFFFT